MLVEPKPSRPDKTRLAYLVQLSRQRPRRGIPIFAGEKFNIDLNELQKLLTRNFFICCGPDVPLPGCHKPGGLPPQINCRRRFAILAQI